MRSKVALSIRKSLFAINCLYLCHSTFYSQMKQSAVCIVCMEENVISWYTLGFCCVIRISVLTVEDFFISENNSGINIQFEPTDLRCT